MNQRGSTLLLVTMITSLLAGMAAALYMITQTQRAGFIAVRQHMMAASRANGGAEAGLALYRGNSPSLPTGSLNSLGYASFQAALDAMDAGVSNAYSAYKAPLDTNGIQPYEADMYYRTAAPGSFASSQAQATLVIHAIGYSAAQGSPNQSTAVVELDVMTPAAQAVGYSGGN